MSSTPPPHRPGRGDGDRGETPAGEATDHPGIFSMPQQTLEQFFQLNPQEFTQVRVRMLSLFQSVGAGSLRDHDPRYTGHPDLEQTSVDLVCAGETDGAWLFHGPPGSPIEHLAIAKDQVPERVSWIRLMLDIHYQGEGPAGSGGAGV